MTKVKIIAPYKLEHAKEGDAGYDVKNIGGPVKIPPGKSEVFNTGVKIQMPKGMEAQVRGRSGLWFKKGIMTQLGTIDSGFTGNIQVRLHNLSPITWVISSEERIAQLVFAKYESPEFVEVDELDKTERGKGGFGHSGMH